MTRRGSTSLAGKVILVTRPANQSAELVSMVRSRGATAILAPAIEIVPARSAALTEALEELAAGRFEWITLTSRATVEMLAQRLGLLQQRIEESEAASARHAPGDARPRARTLP